MQRSTDKKLEKQWRTTKKVGSMVGDEEDVVGRKSLSIAELNKTFGLGETSFRLLWINNLVL